MKKKVLFVLESTYGNHDSMGVGILSSIAKRRNWDTSLLLRSVHSASESMERVLSFQPDVIAYSFATGEHRNILDLHRRLKKRFDCHTIFGGPHPTFCPDFICEEGVDTICIGEGEAAFENYLDKIESNEDYSHVNNLIVKKGREITKNPLNDLIEDLDSVPFPDRTIFKQESTALYRDFNLIYTSRGCPYSCTYCSNPQLNALYKEKGNIIRLRSVTNVIKEITELDPKPPVVIFLDDNFLIKPDSWMKEFIERYGEKIKLPFAICTSADRINESVIKSLKEIGLRSVVYALETGDDRINKDLLRRSVKVESVKEAGRILKKYGLFTTLQNITLLPVNNPFELDLKTLKINQQIRPSLAVSTPLSPYPGTEIAAHAVKHGYLTPDRSRGIEKINKVDSVLNFKNKRAMKKSLVVHYFFDLMVQYPVLTPFYKVLSLLPLSVLKIFYNIYELNFAYKRHFLYIGVKFNFKNIKRLVGDYIAYKSIC